MIGFAEFKQSPGKTINKSCCRTNCNQNIHIGHSIPDTLPGASSEEIHTHHIYRDTQCQLNPWIFQHRDMHPAMYHMHQQRNSENKAKQESLFMTGKQFPSFGGRTRLPGCYTIAKGFNPF